MQQITRYDAAGNVIGQRDALGRWTVIDYDALHRPITTTLNYENGDPLTVDVANQGWADVIDTDLVTVTRYGADGQPARTIQNYVDGVFTATQPITDLVTLFAYDAISRPISTTQNLADITRSDLNRLTRTVYDPQGRVAGQRDALGRWTSQHYDVLGRVDQTIANCQTSAGLAVASGCAALLPSLPDRNVPQTTRFDALGRAWETVDALGHVTRTIYGQAGQALGTIQNYVPAAPSTTMTNVLTLQAFDALGRTVVMTDATGAVSRMAYNGLGQVITTTNALTLTTQQGYDGQGRARWTRRPDGQFTVQTLDGLGRTVATTVNYQNSASTAMDVNLTSDTVYDVAGRRVAVVDPKGHRTTFRYDLLGPPDRRR